MRPFNLEEYLNNPSYKIVTRIGKPVRIICTDAKGNYPIIALVTTRNGDEASFEFTKDGLWQSKDHENSLDLFFATVKKEGWINLYKDEGITYLPGIIHDSEEDAKKAMKDDPDFIATIKIEWEE